MRTVYIFGAGASRHIGYPLASTMGTELLDWMGRHASGRYDSSVELLRKEFGNSPNFEDVITRLSNAFDIPPATEEERLRRASLGHARGQLGEAIREWFREIHSHPAPAYAKFADRVVEPGDVVITFNYDDSLERELKRAGKWGLSIGYGFALGSTRDLSSILILKLHGSINWLVSIFGGITSGQFSIGSNSLGNHPVIHKADADYLGYANFLGHTYSGGGAFPSLILPGRRKEFSYSTSFGQEWEGFWDGLWLQAEAALRQAEKIVVVGYSLLSVDERACNVILNTPGRSTKVLVLSGGESERIAADFRRAGFSDVSFEADYFERWIHTQMSVGAGEH